MFTRLSVHCALRIVATSSSKRRREIELAVRVGIEREQPVVERAAGSPAARVSRDAFAALRPAPLCGFATLDAFAGFAPRATCFAVRPRPSAAAARAAAEDPAGCLPSTCGRSEGDVGVAIGRDGVATLRHAIVDARSRRAVANARTSSAERAFKISSASSHALRAMPTPIVDVVEPRDRVRVGADLDRHAELFARRQVAPVEIEAVRIGVELDRDARLRGLLEHRVDVDAYGSRDEQQPSRRVTEDREPRIVERASACAPSSRVSVIGKRECTEPMTKSNRSSVASS